MNTNFPPVEVKGASVMELKRATGEIELRAATPELLWNAAIGHSEYAFGELVQLGPLLWTVKGMLHGSV